MHKAKLLIISILCTAFITGCYPTGEIVGNDNISYGAELNESPREGLIYKFTLPEEYPETYNVKTAKFRNFDIELAEELIPHCTEDTINVEKYDDGYTLYQKEDSYVCFMPGTVSLTKENDNNIEVLLQAFLLPKTSDQIRNEFPRTEISDFSSVAYLEEMQRFIDILDIETDNELQVYAVTNEESNYINQTYNKGILEDLISDDCYIIKNTPILGGLPVANSSFLCSMADWVSMDSKIYGAFDKNGLLDFEAYNIPEICKLGDDEKICSPEYAVSQIKDFIEGINNNGTMYGCELRALVYSFNGEAIDEYFVRPVWVFGWQENSEGMLNPYYVDAVSGTIL